MLLKMMISRVTSSSFAVMPKLVGFQLPSPRLRVPPHEHTVPRSSQWTVFRGDSDNRMASPLFGAPLQFPNVKSAAHPRLCPRPVAALLSRRPCDLLFAGREEEVGRPVRGAPLRKLVSWRSGGGAEEDCETRRFEDAQRGPNAGRGGGRLRSFVQPRRQHETHITAGGQVTIVETSGTSLFSPLLSRM